MLKKNRFAFTVLVGKDHWEVVDREVAFVDSMSQARKQAIRLSRILQRHVRVYDTTMPGKWIEFDSGNYSGCSGANERHRLHEQQAIDGGYEKISFQQAIEQFGTYPVFLLRNALLEHVSEIRTAVPDKTYYVDTENFGTQKIDHTRGLWRCTRT